MCLSFCYVLFASCHSNTKNIQKIEKEIVLNSVELKNKQNPESPFSDKKGI